DRWQIGSDGSDMFVTPPSMRKVYRLLYDEFSRLMKSPDLAMPWPAWYDLGGDLPATISLSVPPEVLPPQLPPYMHDIRGHEDHNLSIHLQPISAERYGRELQIRDFARRFVYTVAAGAQRIDMELPLSVQNVDGRLENQPTEMFTVARTLMS